MGGHRKKLLKENMLCLLEFVLFVWLCHTGPDQLKKGPKRVYCRKERQGMLGVERVVVVRCPVKNLVTGVLHLCLSSAPSKRRKRGLYYLGQV